MTEMVFSAIPKRVGEPVLPRWWRTLDKWTLVAVLGLFAIGILLGLAASVPLAERNGLPTFYYVTRQLEFGGIGLAVMLGFSMLTPLQVRRLGVLGFLLSFLALALLPLFGTDFGKGAVRWFSFGFASVQPSEFLKPGFAITVAWLMAASLDVGGPPGKRYSLLLTLVVVGLLATQPDFGQAALVLFIWCVIYFVAGAPFVLLVALAGLTVLGGFGAYNGSEHFARRIDGYLSSEIDPRTQIGYATNAIQEGGLLGVGVGEGTVKWQLPDAHTDFIIAVAAEEYGLILVLFDHRAFLSAVVALSLNRLRQERDSFHPTCRHRACLRLWGAGVHQHGCGGAAVACQGHDAAVCQLRRQFGDRVGHCDGHVAGADADPPAGSAF